MYKFLLPLILLFSVSLLAGCGTDEDLSDHPLTGNWVWNDDGITPLNFNADGTGNRDWWGLPDNFDWSVNGENLDKDMTSGFVVDNGFLRGERWTFEINGNNLTISSRQEAGLVFHYTRR